MIFNLFKIFHIIKKIKKENIKNLIFTDSYGGMLGLFQLFEMYKLNKKKNLIICNQKKVYEYLLKQKYFGKNLIYVPHEKYYLKNYLFEIYNLFFSILNVKVKNIYAYKLSTDILRNYLVNIVSDKRTKIRIIDHFYKSYNTNSNKKNLKIFLINLINFFLKIKIHTYGYIDINRSNVLCFNKKFLIRPSKKYSWSYFEKKLFKNSKLKIKKKSVILIDEATEELARRDLINLEKSKNKILIKIKKFIKLKKIKNIYIKTHPTSKVNNFFLSDKRIKIIKINSLEPIEFFINSFSYCVFSVTSSVFLLKTKTKLFSFINLYIYKNPKSKKIVYNFFKKNIGINLFKTNFLK